MTQLIEVDLPAKARKAYEDMKRDFIMMYESGEVLAVNAAVQVRQAITNMQRQRLHRRWRLRRNT